MSTESKAAHTPQPWKAGIAEISFNDDRWLSAITADRQVATVFGRTREEAEANARLIAAAPETAKDRDKLKALNDELLDVVLGIRDLIDRCGLKVNADFDAAVTAVIAKSEAQA